MELVLWSFDNERLTSAALRVLQLAPELLNPTITWCAQYLRSEKVERNLKNTLIPILSKTYKAAVHTMLWYTYILNMNI